MIDQDQLGMMQKLAQGVDLSEEGQAMDAIREVGPGSHYLGCAHTQANFQTAFYRSPLMDNNSFEQWEIEGEKRIEQRANALCRGLKATRHRRLIRRSTRLCLPSSRIARIRCRTLSPERLPQPGSKAVQAGWRT
jgi:trimethylamine:corrinoid methyltransferase-like protein